jgi:hypothetical protein
VFGSDAQLTSREGGDIKARQPKAKRERDATPDLLLKHLDATLTTYISRQMKHTSKTLAKTPPNHCKT